MSSSEASDGPCSPGSVLSPSTSCSASPSDASYYGFLSPEQYLSPVDELPADEMMVAMDGFKIDELNHQMLSECFSSTVMPHSAAVASGMLSPAYNSEVSSAASSPQTAAPAQSAKPEPAKKKRKRRRKKDEPPHVPTALTIERERLLKMSLTTFDRLVASVIETRKLTPDEVRDVKRQRRLIKNRESAQASRVRRKCQLEEMERQIEEMQRERDQLREQVSHLQQDNSRLQSVIQSLSGSMSTATSQLWDAFSVGGGDAPSTAAVNMKRGVCLMVVLFSFAVLFNVGWLGADPSMSDGPMRGATPAMRYMYTETPGNEVSRRPNALAQPGGMRLLEVDEKRAESMSTSVSLGRPSGVFKAAPTMSFDPTVHTRASTNNMTHVMCEEAVEGNEAYEPMESAHDIVIALFEPKAAPQQEQSAEGASSYRKLLCSITDPAPTEPDMSVGLGSRSASRGMIEVSA